MKKFVSILFLLSLLITACEAASTPADQPIDVTPTLAPYSPDTPSPPILDLPLVEGPQLITIRFLNSLDGWGVTETHIVRTNDGGTTWYNVTPQDVAEAGYNVDIFVLDNNHAWVHLPDFENYPNSGHLYRTTDGGLTWSSSSTPFSRGHIRFLDPSNGWVLADLGVGAGSNAVAVYQTRDGGEDWQQTFINDPNSADAGDSLPLGGLKFGIAPSDLKTAWVYGVVYTPGAAYLYRTYNAGQLWEQASIPLPPEAENADITIEQLEFVTPNDAFLAMRISSDSTNLAIYISYDSGNTWTLTPTLIPDGGPADFLSAEEAVIYNGSQFYVTRDAGRTWSIIPPDVKFGDTFAVMDFVSPSTGWVIALDPTTNHRSLYKTADGGMTWFPVLP
ncbi:MAG TPA: hypothetical protein VK851_05120 [Anaerolineales bacterium]|nr:hypothetical protein [Anaerolineales bacterium]